MSTNENQELKKAPDVELVKAIIDDVQKVWKKTDVIRRVFAPDLTNDEFAFFLGMGMSLQANPFKREIWPVKYGQKPVEIIVARDLYRRRAEEQPTYKGHVVEAVYKGEKFIPNPATGEVEHEIDVDLRYGGEPIHPLGAYCVVHVENRIPTYIFCPTREYVKYTKEGNVTKFWSLTDGKTLGEGKVETMIKKVAESQGLRSAFQGIFAGTYTSDEAALMKEEDREEIKADVENLEDAIRDSGDEKPSEPQPEKEEPQVDKKPEITMEDFTELNKLLEENNIKDPTSWMKQFGVNSFKYTEITAEQFKVMRATLQQLKDGTYESLGTQETKHVPEQPPAEEPKPEPGRFTTGGEPIADARQLKYIKNEVMPKYISALLDQNIKNEDELAVHVGAKSFNVGDVTEVHYEKMKEFLRGLPKDPEE